MGTHFDHLERQDAAARAKRQLGKLRTVLAMWGERLAGGTDLTSFDELRGLPVLRKSQLVQWQAANPPFGTVPVRNVTHVFQSPGPIYEPGSTAPDWWRFGRFLHAAGIGTTDVVQNCFAYHLTPAGMMFESGALAVGARVLPAGTGQTELQVQAAAAVGVTVYAGTPDYLKVILEKADDMGVKLEITKAIVSGGALFPSLREWYAARGISCLQCYATADLGLIAYESPAMDGMIIDEGVIVEIVTPGTGDPVSPGEVGEVVVTALNPDYPLIRFATGDLSATMEGTSACGRTNTRIKGWMGRADQTTKIKGMFVRTEQVANLVAKLGATRVRVIADREDETDTLHVQVEGADMFEDEMEDVVKEVLKLSGTVETMDDGALPRDGMVIEDRRTYDS